MSDRLKLLSAFLDPSRIQRIEDGNPPSPRQEAWLTDIYGEFSGRILTVSPGVENLVMQDITILGGWCAVRTADLVLLREGEISDPETGSRKKYKTVSEVANWLTRAIGIDQIVEAIGIYKGDRYVAISEEKLWSDRVKTTVAGVFQRELTTAEETEIDEAMQIAEKKRARATERYIKFITGKSTSLTRVVDRDIYDNLVEVRDEMFKDADVSLSDLVTAFPKERQTESYTLVWGMYTGPYVALLQNAGYIQTSKGVITEPWIHGTAETQARSYFNERYFANGRRNQYLSPGANESAAFVGFADISTANGQRLRKTDVIDEIPNELNYKAFLEDLGNFRYDCLTLADNSAFMWGVNLLPFGKTKEVLLEMINIRKAYVEAKKSLSGEKEQRRKAAEDLKDFYSKLMEEQAMLVITQLQEMLKFVFS